MKLVISGSTGFIGQEVLAQALAHPSITSIVALSRKPLPEHLASNSKLEVAIVKDFENYAPDVLEQLKGSDAAIWTIGAKSLDPDVTRKVTLGYTTAATEAFSRLTKDSKKPFRFVFVSGILAVKDQKASVWLYPATRKVAGETENKLISLNKPDEGFSTYIARPGGVLAKDTGLLKNVIMGLAPSIKVDQLAASLIDVAVNGGQKRVLENADLVRKAKEVLRTT